MGNKAALKRCLGFIGIFGGILGGIFGSCTAGRALWDYSLQIGTASRFQVVLHFVLN
jgi:hypothetical protein